ncbi:MerR family transcriptional regulator [Escherichia coli]|nr:MerR family transcriptional regulator [Escherichia coli]
MIILSPQTIFYSARKGNVSCPLIASLQGEAGLARSAMP